METMKAPDLTEGYPSLGKKIGPAWQAVWNELTKRPGEWLNGKAIWVPVAGEYDLHPDTVRHLMFNAAKSGVIEKAIFSVAVHGVGHREQAHFRLAAPDATT